MSSDMMHLSINVKTKGDPITVNCPDLTHRCLIPHRLVINQLSEECDEDGNRIEKPVKDITSIKVQSGGGEVVLFSRQVLRLNNVCDFTPYESSIEKRGNVQLTLNQSKGHNQYIIHVFYKHSYGGILYDEKCQSFDKVMSSIVDKGICTKLILSFNKPLASLEFPLTATCHEDEDLEQWIDPLGLPIDSEKSTVDEVYEVDFTEPGIISHPSDIKNMTLVVREREDENDDERREPLIGYVIAYGFTH